MNQKRLNDDKSVYEELPNSGREVSCLSGKNKSHPPVDTSARSMSPQPTAFIAGKWGRTRCIQHAVKAASEAASPNHAKALGMERDLTKRRKNSVEPIVKMKAPKFVALFHSRN